MDELQKGRDGWRSLWRWWIEEFLDGFAVQEMTSDEIGDRVQADASGKHGLLSDSDQQEGDQGRDDLKLDGILRGTQELLDPEVLLDPFEEQLDLPAGLIEVGNFAGWGDEIVGEDAHTGAVVENDGDLAQSVLLKGVLAVARHAMGKPDQPVAVDAVIDDRTGLDQLHRSVFFDARHEAASALDQARPPGKVVITLVKHVGSGWQDRHLLGFDDIIHPRRGDAEVGWAGGLGIVDQMQLGSSVAGGEARPRAQGFVERQGRGID